MKSLYIACTAVLLLQYISLSMSCSNPHCSCKCDSDPPLKLIFQIVAHFGELQGCGRKFTTSQSVSSDGVRRINYQAELKEGESAIDVCDCIHGYLSQKDWLVGSTESCCKRKNVVTMTLEGEPDPTFDNTTTANPLEQLEQTFAQFRYGEFENYHCQMSTSKDKAGKTHFYNECDLRSDSPSKDEVDEMCKRFVAYLNQGNWLGEMTYTCKIKGNVLYMDMMGKEQ